MLTAASVVELTSNDGGLVLNITSNFAEPSVTQIAIDNFGQLTSEGRSLVIENILNGASPEDLPEYAEAMLSIEKLTNAVNNGSLDNGQDFVALVDLMGAAVGDVPGGIVYGAGGPGLIDWK